MIHLHGELMKACSSDDPDDTRYHVQLDANHYEVAPGEKAGDGSLLRPFIVFFGEAVPMISVAAEAVMEADIMIIIGTSLAVYPAAGLIHYFNGDKIILTAYGNIKYIAKGASEGMEELMGILNNSNL